MVQRNPGLPRCLIFWRGSGAACHRRIVNWRSGSPPMRAKARRCLNLCLSFAGAKGGHRAPELSNRTTAVQRVGFGGVMKSSVVKHSIQLQRHKTSVSLEDPFWNDLKKIAIDQRVTLSELVTTIDESRGQGNLSSAIRLFVLNHVRSQKRMDGHGGGSEGTPEFSSGKRHGQR